MNLQLHQPQMYCMLHHHPRTPLLVIWRGALLAARVGNYSCLKVDLMFTRDRSFYFTTVFIPGIILVTSSFITFWLEWNAVPARVMIGELHPIVKEIHPKPKAITRPTLMHDAQWILDGLWKTSFTENVVIYCYSYQCIW